MRRLPTAAVFSRGDARALGWSDAALTRAVRSGRILRLRRDQFTLAGGGPVPAALAAHRSCAGSAISHRSAALLHGLPLVGPPPPVPELTVVRAGTGDVHAAHLYRAGLRDQDLMVVGDAVATSVARTVTDLARHHSPRTAVAAADHALHRGLTTTDELTESLEFCRRWPGAERAGRSLALADGRAESALESVSRLVLRQLRLPVPDLQCRIRNDRGVVIARTDFYWDEFGVVGEADGRGKFRLDEDVAATWDRHTDLDDLGLQLARWGWRDATARPHLIEARVRGAMDRGRQRAMLGLPRRWSLAAG